MAAALAFLTTAALSLTALGSADAVAAKPAPPLGAWTRSLPQHAVPGSTAQRRAAWNALTPAQKQQVIASFELSVTPRITARALRPPAAPAGAAPGADWKSAVRGSARSSSGPAPSFTSNARLAPAAGAGAHQVPSASHVTPLLDPSVDSDGDGLPDQFEQDLADAFTPLYHVSAGEQPGTGFAIFQQYQPTEIVQSVTGPVPPVSYFRVSPLGLATNSSGQTVEAIRIDYLTLWNQDDGLQIGDTCSFGLDVILGLVGVAVSAVLDGASSHYLDNERSAALVAAPINPDGSIDFNAADYSGYSYYTAAHEGTFLDHSAYLNPSSPVPAGNHLNLALSVAKHSTYIFNPDGMPLIPGYIIDAAYATIDALWADGTIDDYTYSLYLFLADTVFYSCIIEHFGDQGGSYAQTRINVGEPGNPMNGSYFIADPLLAPKFAPLW